MARYVAWIEDADGRDVDHELAAPTLAAAREAAARLALELGLDPATVTVQAA